MRRAPASTLRTAVARLWPLVSLVAIVAAVTYLTLLGGTNLDTVTTNALVNLILVVGLYVFVGNSGVFSFGHMSFMAIGAYAGAIFAMSSSDKEFTLPSLPHFLEQAHLSPILAVLAGAVAAAVFAAVISIPLMRLNGIGASLATFAVLAIVYVVSSNWMTYTGGQAGIIGEPTSTTRNSALAWAVAAMVVAYTFQRSRVGLRLRASREDEYAARSIGVTIFLERRLAFAVSGLIVGVGGALYGALYGSFSPDAFYLNITFLTVAMLVVGGRTSLAGAVIGTIVISAAVEAFRHVEQGVNLGLFKIPARPGLEQVAVGLMMLVILLLRPRGLTNGREIGWTWTRDRLGLAAAPNVEPHADADPEGA